MASAGPLQPTVMNQGVDGGLGALMSGGNSPAAAATQGPCDIYAAAGTPCVAAHSTTRALYASYSGALYQGLHQPGHGIPR